MMTYEEKQLLIQKDEEEGREYVKKHILQNYYHLPENYYHFRDIDDVVDVDITATTTEKTYTYVGEIKKRAYSFEYNSPLNWMLEIKKYNALNEEHQKTGDRRLYFNIFRNNMVVVWDLERMNFNNLSVENSLFNATTSYTTKDKNKDYFDLPYKQYKDGTQVKGISIFQIVSETDTKRVYKY
ncbi:hypothetical protein EZS27_014625 [termite gut metagenome]|uniref:Uncharacterized protein n=1 Tax=termite gut metagenome TaxID=433724 RepID=A0A5J4RTK1_9ZZZZ